MLQTAVVNDQLNRLCVENCWCAELYYDCNLLCLFQEQEKLLTSLRKELNVGLEKHAVSARPSINICLCISRLLLIHH